MQGITIFRYSITQRPNHSKIGAKASLKSFFAITAGRNTCPKKCLASHHPAR